MVVEREADCPDPGLHVVGDRVGAATAHVHADVEVRRDIRVLDHGRAGDDPNVGDVAKWNRRAARGLDGEPLDGVDIVANLGCAPHHHVEDLLLFEQVAHGDAGQQRRRRSANLTGLDADLAGAVEIDLDLERRFEHRQVHAWMLRPP